MKPRWLVSCATVLALFLAWGGRAGRPLAAQAVSGTAQADTDSDGDGLPDFQEVHKYGSDPQHKDSRGTGVSDGDWQQRRESTYSIRAVMRVMPPYNLQALNDDYQDARVLSVGKDYVELEFVVYPLNTNVQAIHGNPNWRKDYAGMTEYLKPGITTNWDEALRADVVRALAEDGFELDGLNDKEVVELVSRWLLGRSKSLRMFCTFFVDFPHGKPTVLKGLEKAFERDKGDPTWSVPQQFQHELLGKQMFAHKTRGSCTSTAIYQTTVLRALGIPTRMILCIPPGDASDSAQIDMVARGLTHGEVGRQVIKGLLNGRNSFTSHMFCEVFVGGRWRRLNATALGENVLSSGCLGLMIKVHTFNDLSEANLAATWGARFANHVRSDTFPHTNPYCLLEISDHFGKYASVPNPPVGDLRQVTIEKMYWFDSPNAPARAREVQHSAEPGGRSLWLHCPAFLGNVNRQVDHRLFMERATKEFVLSTPGKPDVACQLRMTSVTDSDNDVCEVEVIIPPAEYTKMAVGVGYTLRPLNADKQYVWRVREGLLLVRDFGGGIPMPGAPPGGGAPDPRVWYCAGSRWYLLQDVARSQKVVLHSYLHTAEQYQEMLAKAPPGSRIVLLVSLSRDERVPLEFSDLLPLPWPKIEAALRKGKNVERVGRARQQEIVLLAAPTSSRLTELLRRTKLLAAGSKGK